VAGEPAHLLERRPLNLVKNLLPWRCNWPARALRGLAGCCPVAFAPAAASGGGWSLPWVTASLLRGPARLGTPPHPHDLRPAGQRSGVGWCCFSAELPTQVLSAGLTLNLPGRVVVAVQPNTRCGALPSPPVAQRMGLAAGLSALSAAAVGALLLTALRCWPLNLTPTANRPPCALAAAAVVVLPLFRHLPAPKGLGPLAAAINAGPPGAGATLLAPARHCSQASRLAGLKPGGLGRWRCSATATGEWPLPPGGGWKATDPVGTGWFGLPCWPHAGVSLVWGWQALLAGGLTRRGPWASPIGKKVASAPAPAERDPACGDLLKLEGGALQLYPERPAKGLDRL